MHIQQQSCSEIHRSIFLCIKISPLVENIENAFSSLEETLALSLVFKFIIA